MRKITVITPSNIEVEYRLAGAGSRFGAFVIDFSLQVVAIIVFAWITISVSGGFFPYRGLTGGISGTVLAILLIGFFVIYFGYFIFFEYMMNGQTIGKRILGLRVIQENGEPANFFQILIRGFLRSSVDMLYVGVFIILFSKKHKRLGDMAAGTIVISENSASLDEAPSFMLPSSPWPETFPDPYNLSNEEKMLAQEFLRRKHTLRDSGERIDGIFKEYFELQKNTTLLHHNQLAKSTDSSNRQDTAPHG